jgi:hypothetical protein
MVEEMDSRHSEIEKFNGCNFSLWKLKMESFLIEREQNHEGHEARHCEVGGLGQNE